MRQQLHLFSRLNRKSTKGTHIRGEALDIVCPVCGAEKGKVCFTVDANGQSEGLPTTPASPFGEQMNPYSEEEMNRALDAEKLRDTLHWILKTLSPRREFVIKSWFGFECEKLTLSQMAKQFGVKPDRIRQVKDRSMRQLRHPSRSRRLRNWMDML